MKKLLMALVALFTIASPAYASTNGAFTGPRIEATAGGTNHSDKITYGAAAGLDIPLGDRFTVGGEATATNVFDRDRIFGANGRLGFAVVPRLLVFGSAGYEDYTRRGRDGLRYGGGAEYSLGRFGFLKAEYIRSDRNRRDTGLIGAGLRF